MKIKVTNTSNNPLPAYASLGSAGLDLRANIEFSIVLDPSDRISIPTGIHLELTHGFEGQVRPRSGLALKKGIIAILGTIDSDYRGEICVILINTSNEPYRVSPGDRIAQLVVAAYRLVEWEECAILSATIRGKKGFGSSGIR